MSAIKPTWRLDPFDGKDYRSEEAAIRAARKAAASGPVNVYKRIAMVLDLQQHLLRK